MTARTGVNFYRWATLALGVEVLYALVLAINGYSILPIIASIVADAFGYWRFRHFVRQEKAEVAAEMRTGAILSRV